MFCHIAHYFLSVLYVCFLLLNNSHLRFFPEFLSLPGSPTCPLLPSYWPSSSLWNQSEGEVKESCIFTQYNQISCIIIFFISYYFSLNLQITVHPWGKSVKELNQERNLTSGAGAEAMDNADYWLAPHGFVHLAFLEHLWPQDEKWHCPQISMSSHQSLVKKKMNDELAYGGMLSIESFFPNDFSLCQVNLKLAITEWLILIILGNSNINIDFSYC